jgi:hypothetical protein
MTRAPRVRSILVVAALLALLVPPIAGARTVSGSPAPLSGTGWLGAALHWAEGLAGLRSHGHRRPPVHRKDGGSSSTTNGGSCIDPGGRPNPLCQ